MYIYSLNRGNVAQWDKKVQCLLNLIKLVSGPPVSAAMHFEFCVCFIFFTLITHKLDFRGIFVLIIIIIMKNGSLDYDWH